MFILIRIGFELFTILSYSSEDTEKDFLPGSAFHLLSYHFHIYMCTVL